MPTTPGEDEDDRVAFGELQRSHASALAADSALREASLETTRLSDVHGYSYVWNWLGVPIIQMPTDVMVMQEIIWRDRPQVVIETGVARGGSVVMYASILQLIGDGRVVGVDVDIRPHNRKSIEQHPMAHRIELVEGSSTDRGTVDRVRALVGDAARVMVVLDSNHTHDHVLEELRCYAPLVTRGQTLVVADTIVEQIPVQTHRARPWGPGNSPGSAVAVFLRENPSFAADPTINDKLVMSQSPGGYLRRRL